MEGVENSIRRIAIIGAFVMGTGTCCAQVPTSAETANIFDQLFAGPAGSHPQSSKSRAETTNVFAELFSASVTDSKKVNELKPKTVQLPGLPPLNQAVVGDKRPNASLSRAVKKPRLSKDQGPEEGLTVPSAHPGPPAHLKAVKVDATVGAKKVNFAQLFGVHSGHPPKPTRQRTIDRFDFGKLFVRSEKPAGGLSSGQNTDISDSRTRAKNALKSMFGTISFALSPQHNIPTDSSGTPLSAYGVGDTLDLNVIGAPMIGRHQTAPLSLYDCIQIALFSSPEITALRTDVQVSVAEITRQSAAFDWTTFLTANWDDRSEPVGNDIQGAVGRFDDRQFVGNAGLKRRNLLGGDLELAQELGFQDTNSQFFNPRDQATAFVSLEYNQPLLRGAGRFVNQSIIDLAVTDAQATEAGVIAQTQDIILNVTQAYWSLAAARGRLAALRRSYDRAEAVAKIMGYRTNLDVGPLQKTRADATVASRRSSLVVAENDVVLAQEKLMQLILGAQFSQLVDKEVLITTPVFGPIQEVDLHHEVQIALANRHEIHQAITQIRGSSIEKGVAENQLLPLLSMTLAVSNRGLQGEYQVEQAFSDQWSVGAPTYGIGVEYELPVGNRAANANVRQAKFRLLKLQKDFETVTSRIALEARAASHNASTRGRARNAREDALRLAAKELEMVVRRLELLIDGDAVGQLYLDDLLQTQARLEVAEIDFITASTDYALSQFELQRARGTLLNSPNHVIP